MSLTEEIKEKALEFGADLVGVAPVARFEGAPLRMSPQGLLPEARSVVVAGIHHLDAAVELGGEPTLHDIGPYRSQSTAMNPMLDDISFRLGRFIEDKGFKALPIAASNIWRYHGYKDLKVDFAPDLAHRYAAVAAGLGEIGWNGLTLTPEFGPRARFVSIVTDAELEPTPMYDGEPLCDRCMECVRNCPTNAFRKEVRGTNRISIGGRIFEFPDTNKWRCAWAENFGLNLALEIPERIDEAVILSNLEKHGWHGGEEGACLKFCMVADKREYDPDYCRSPRRRKEPNRTSPPQLLRGVMEIFEGAVPDLLAVGSKESFADDALVNPEYHLPDVQSVLSLGITPMAGAETNQDVIKHLRRALEFTAFRIARFLDLAGYSAVTGTRIADTLAARRLDVYRQDALYTTILTSAPLPSLIKAPSNGKRKADPDELRAFCKSAGADMAGFFSAERYDALAGQLEANVDALKEPETVIDENIIYGAYVPRVQREEPVLKRLEDWLPGARSVVVLGLHFPHAALDTAKVTPAETVGPFAFVQYETLNLLGDLALKVVRELNECGHHATFTFDLAGLASRTKNSRGMLPDMRANRFAAILAGLAHIGLHGHPLTAEHGVRQRFVAIVTDCELHSDPLLRPQSTCDHCKKPCLIACPTSALGQKSLTFRLEEREFRLPLVDCYACDWAKRYCLSGVEGPAYWGMDLDVPLPQTKQAEDAAQALASVKWGVQKRHLNIAEECLRVCPAGISTEKGVKHAE